MRALFLAFWLAATPAFAECEGQNLLDLLSDSQRSRIEARAEAEPYSSGNFWTASRHGQTVTLVGTYHLGDPRHDATMTALSPRIAAASTVLVEAGPDQEKQLMERVKNDPSVMLLTDTTLPTLLSTEDWELLSSALLERGIPGFMAAKFQPWYISMMLATAPCDLQAATDRNGLDARIMDHAEAAGVPVRALEPYDTVFRIFDSLTMEDQLNMVRTSLAMEGRVEDFSTTLADIYFSGQTRVIWELMRFESARLPGATEAAVDADLAQMEQAMMISRNRDWIPVIEDAARQGPVVAAFGALHLSGKEGVANLLAERGWNVSPLAVP